MKLTGDLRYGLRLLRTSPGFTAAVVVSLALGIGANTALFSVVDCVLLRPLPYPDSERLYSLWSKPPKGGITNISPANFLDFRARSQSFDYMAGAGLAEVNVSVHGAAERMVGIRVTADFFRTLGVQPAMGRDLTADDDRPGAPRVAILSYASFQRRFGADRRLLGQPLTVDGEPCTLIGVLPPSFRFVLAPEIWLPFTIDPAKASRDFHALAVFVKLKRAVPPESALAEVKGIAANLAQAYPKSLAGWSVDLFEWHEWIVGQHRRQLWVLFAAVAFVLLIACVNVANLLLAKAAARQRELAVRTSLGATRGRLITQVLTESLLLSLLGGLAGLLLASWLTELAAAIVPSNTRAAVAAIAIDGRVLLFTVAVSVVTGLLFGAAPAWRASKADLLGILKDAGRGSTEGSSGGRLRSALVVVELALSLVLLVGAGLMVRSMAAIHATNPGFNPDDVLTMRVTMPESRYAEEERVRAFDRQLLEKVQALPGVRAATLAMSVPLQGIAVPMRFELASQPPLPAAERLRVPLVYASGGYFETLRIPLRRGRFFTDRDSETAPRVAVVNEAFVSKYLSKEEPLGATLRLDEQWVGTGKGNPLPWQIVGIAGNVKTGSLTNPDGPQMWVPLWQCTRPGGVLAVRSEMDPQRLAQALRNVVRSLDKDVPLTDVKTMREIAGDGLAGQRLNAWMIWAFAAVALVLAAVGTYGVISYRVARTTHEMGIRMALGAQPGDLLKRTLLRGLAMAGLGLALGLAASFALSRTIRGLLYSVQPNDAITYVVVSLLLLAVALLATYIPARRAARVDPLVALRSE